MQKAFLEEKEADVINFDEPTEKLKSKAELGAEIKALALTLGWKGQEVTAKILELTKKSPANLNEQEMTDFADYMKIEIEKREVAQ